MASTGPGLLNRVYVRFQQLGTLDVGIFPKEKFNPCCMCDRNCKIPEGAYMAQVFDGSWNELDTRFLNLLNCNWKMTGLVIFLFILFLWAWFRRQGRG